MATGPTPEQLARATKLAQEQERYERALRDATKAQEDLNKVLKEGRANEQAALTISQKQAEISKSRLDIEEELTKIEKSRNDALKERADIQGKIQQKIVAMETMVPAMVETAQKDLDLLKEKLVAAKENEQLLRDQAVAQRDTERSLNRQEKILERNLKLQEDFGDEIVKNLKDAEDRANSFGQIFSDMAGELPVIGSTITKSLNMFAKAPETLNRIAKAGSNMGGVLGGVVTKAASGLSKAIAGINPAFLAANVAMVAFAAIAAKMALEVSELSKGIGRATGFGDKFNTEITRMGSSGAMLGISFKDAAAALTSMTEGLSSFNPAAEETNAYVGMTIAKLDKLGVSSASSVKSIDHMQRAMGMTAKQAADTTAQLARMGKEIGITGTKMINDFNAASGRLAIYGKQNTKVFKELAAQAKATGIEMQSLINISSKFDTFDAAAESAGKLNAVLGTQLSTIEMMNATDSERVMILKQEVQASVGNFDNLDKFTKQYVAQAMGVASVDEAQRLLNMSTAEYNKYSTGQKESAEIQKELAAATAEMVPLMSQLKMVAIKVFMLFQPLISGFTAIGKLATVLFQKLASMTSGMGEFNILGTILKTVLVGIGIGLAFLFGPISGVVAGILAVVAAVGALYDIFHKPGSLSMAEGMFDKDIGASMSQMGSDAIGAQKDISDLSSEMEGMHDTVHKGGGNAIDIQAMASLDTSAIAAGFDKIKSAVMELSSVKIDGFLAMRTDGSSSSFVMGSDGLIKSISEGKLTVDVKIPDMKMPDISVKVYIGDRELRDIIRTEAKAVVGRAG